MKRSTDCSRDAVDGLFPFSNSSSDFFCLYEDPRAVDFEGELEVEADMLDDLVEGVV